MINRFLIKNKNKSMDSGVLCGVASAVTWGIDTVLLGMIILIISNLNIEKAIILAPFISAFLHDAFSAIWLIFYIIIRKKTIKLKECLKKKSVRCIIIGGILGGPVGMIGYNLAIKYIGPSYAAELSSLYPAVGVIMAKFILKEKMNKVGWCGLILSIIGIVHISQPSVVGDKSIIGFVFIIICIIGWGSEAVVCSIGMKDEIDYEIALFIRQTTSMLFYASLVIPMVGGMDLTFEIFKYPVILLLAITALLGTMSYLFYYKSICKIGASKAMGINISYFIWAIVFECIFMGTELSLRIVVFGIMIMFGSYLIAKDQ